MSKRKRKDECCCSCCTPCCCTPCCNTNRGFGNFAGEFDNGLLIAIVFWLIACGAGILNTSSILIILLFILYSWTNERDGLFGMSNMAY